MTQTLQQAIYNPDLNPDLQQVLASTLLLGAEIDGATYGRRTFCRLAGELYAYGTDGKLYHLTAPMNAGAVAGAAVHVATIGWKPNTADEFIGKLWFGSFASGNIKSWDGTYLVSEATTLGSGPVLMAAYHEEILAFGTNWCQKRNLNGTWSAVTMPGPTDGVNSFKPRARAVYKDVLYIAGYDDDATFPGIILSWNGTTLAVAHTVLAGNAVEAFAGVTDLCVFNGYLYFGYQQTGGSRACKLGIFDGSTWTDAHKDLLAQISPSADLVIGAMAEYRGNLVIGFGADGAALYRSPGLTTSGTWVLLSALEAVYDMVASV